MAKHKIVKNIDNLHSNLYHELNDIHIFLSHTLPLLRDTAERYHAIESSADETFLVPSKIGKKAIARRTPKEVAELFDRFAKRELHANMFLVCVSRIESYLNDILRVFLSEYPKKISVGLKGGESSKQVPISIVLESSSLDEARNTIIESRLQGIFYAEPKDYLKYFHEITSIKISEDKFDFYIEAKATRDLIVHNSGVINDLYLHKAGDNARGKAGNIIQLNEKYFGKCVSSFKSISSEIKTQVEVRYNR
jgi:hypothetical protein